MRQQNHVLVMKRKTTPGRRAWRIKADVSAGLLKWGKRNARHRGWRAWWMKADVSAGLLKWGKRNARQPPGQPAW